MTTPNTPNAAERPSDEVVAAWRDKVHARYKNQQGKYRDIVTIAAEMLAAEATVSSELSNSTHPAESVSAEPAAIPEPQETRLARQFAKAASVIREIAGMGHDSTDKEVADEALRVARLWVNDDSHDGILREYLRPQPSTRGAVSDEAVEVALTAFYGIDSRKYSLPPNCRRDMRAALESFAGRSAAAKEDHHG